MFSWQSVRGRQVRICIFNIKRIIEEQRPALCLNVWTRPREFDITGDGIAAQQNMMKMPKSDVILSQLHNWPTWKQNTSVHTLSLIFWLRN